MSTLVSNEIRPFLNEIANRLWANRAAIMVGAGFSKNASGEFPDWSQLGDVFYEKAYGKAPSIDDTRYLNVLKLAGEVQATIGRPALDNLLRDKIPDLNVSPSDLHIDLLKLPWADVFTTNYDTLLERASNQVVSSRYTPVLNKEDLPYADTPRIVKLHGSFPSERPFIITEEDYRCYPKDNAPFVNTVQQALLENTLCLIGFSGDDPNFLQWIGWIKDHLGRDKKQNIYLIGVFDLPVAQQQLLADRGITIVDFSTCDDISSHDHQKAFSNFIAYLQEAKPRTQDWPVNFNSAFSVDRDKDLADELRNITNDWRKQRQDCPNWLILPQAKRHALQQRTFNWVHTLPKREDNLHEIDILYTYELIWQLDQILLSITDPIEELGAQLLEKYWPFSVEQSEKKYQFCVNDGKTTDYSWVQIREAWLFIAFALLRSYREEGALERWNSMEQQLQSLLPFLSSEQKNALSYETYLFHIFTLDLSKAKDCLKSWEPKPAQPYWMIKKAAALAEIGDLKAAQALSLEGLKNIRAKIIQQKGDEVSLLSLEGYAMQVVKFIQNVDWRNLDASPAKENGFSQRWNELKAYNIDPWGENAFFNSALEKEPNFKKNITEERNYEIGSVSKTRHLFSYEPETFTAYTFLRYYEIIGMPFLVRNTTMGKDSALGSVKRIAAFAPFWAMATLIRTGDTKAVKYLFSRESIHRQSMEEVDVLVNTYLNALQVCQNEINSADVWEGGPFSLRLADILPEVISRLCSKCSRDAKKRILEFIIQLYVSPTRRNYQNVGHLITRFIKSLSDEEKKYFLNDLLSIQYPVGLHFIDEQDYKNPLIFIQTYKEEKISLNISIDTSVINSLLSSADALNEQKGRVWALQSLIYLYKAGVLTDQQKEKFASALWAVTGEDGMPCEIGYYRFAFLKLPHPNNVSPKKLFKTYIKEKAFPVRKNKEEKGIAITNGDLPVVQELIGGTDTVKGIWKQADIEELFDKIHSWWHLDKEYLAEEKKRPIGFGDEEFQARFAQLLRVVSWVIAPRIKDKRKKELRALILDMKSYGLHTFTAEAACVRLFPDTLQQVLADVRRGLRSQDKNERSNALNSLEILTLGDWVDSEAPLLLLIQYLAWCSGATIADALNLSYAVILKSKDNKTLLIEAVIERLESLLIETNYTSFPEDIDFDINLEIRLAAARIAAELWSQNEKNKTKNPDILKEWRKVCSSSDEFAEIRNLWLIEG